MTKHFWTCLRFYTRLPTPADAGGHAPPDFEASGWAIPLVGALVGAIGGVTLLTVARLGLSPMLAGTLTVTAMALITGALHEDGFADFIDGVGGGATRDAKLAIMRDSRLGSYGALALCLTSLLRVFALATLAQTSAGTAGSALIFAGATSRSAGLLPMSLLPPARTDGAGAAATAPSLRVLGAMAGKAALIAFLPLLSGVSPFALVLAFLLAYAACVLITRVAQQQIGGYTGDVLGAAQQAAEIVMLMTLSAGEGSAF